MRTNNYRSLIHFKIKLHRQSFFFINEHDDGGSNLNIQHRVHL